MAVPLPLGSSFNDALLQYTNLTLDSPTLGPGPDGPNASNPPPAGTFERRPSTAFSTPSLQSVSEEDEELKDHIFAGLLGDAVSSASRNRSVASLDHHHLQEEIDPSEVLVDHIPFNPNDPSYPFQPHNPDSKPQLSRLSLPANFSTGPATSADVPPDQGSLISVALDRVRQYRSASAGERSILQSLLHSKVGLVPSPSIAGNITPDIMSSNGVYAVSGENWRGQQFQGRDYGNTPQGSPLSVGRSFHRQNSSQDLQQSSSQNYSDLQRPGFSSQSSFGSGDNYSGEHSRNASYENLQSPYGYTNRPTLPALDMSSGSAGFGKDMDPSKYRPSPMLPSTSSGRLTHTSNNSMDGQDHSPNLRTPPDYPVQTQPQQSPATYQSAPITGYDSGQSSAESYGHPSYWAGPHYNSQSQPSMFPPPSFEQQAQGTWQAPKSLDSPSNARPGSSQQTFSSASRPAMDPYGNTPAMMSEGLPPLMAHRSLPTSFATTAMLAPMQSVPPPARHAPPPSSYGGSGVGSSATAASGMAGGPGSSVAGNEWELYIQAYVKSYVEAPNRYAAGERKVIVHSPRVGQKSYGTEKRYLCPPPMVTVVGNTWWNKDQTGNPLNAPVINVAISQEIGQPDSKATWTTTQGRSFEESMGQAFRPGEEPFIGRTSGKALHISEQADKKRVVKAIVSIKAPSWQPETGGAKAPERQSVIGTFESKEIKIISKPSKKRQSSKTSDLCIQHGTTISLFNRLRSQTSSTKFLAVTPTVSKQRGSDGKPLLTAQQLPPDGFGFTADANCWDPFLLWLVDPSKPAPDTNASPIPNGDSFLPPDDVITVLSTDAIPIIFYNQCIRLQCPNTGLLSPRFVVRRVETPTTVSGGDGSRKDAELGVCPVGELPGDPISQLHKVAFEIYQDGSIPIHGPDMLSPGQWLTCEGDAIKIRTGKSARTWSMVPSINTSPQPARHARQFSSSLPSTPSSHYTPLQPMTPRVGPGAGGPSQPPSAPVSPGGVYATSFGSSVEGSYFSMQRKQSSSSGGTNAPTSGQNTPWDETHDPSSGGPGPTRRRRGSSSASQTAYISPMTTKERHVSRPSIDMMAQSMTGMGITVGGTQYAGNVMGGQGQIMQPQQQQQQGMYDHGGMGTYAQMLGMQGMGGQQVGASSRWIIEVTETATWTIVGTESKAYTFWIPPFVQELEQPITPFPELHKYLPPGQAAEQKSGLKKFEHQYTSLSTLPLATFYGTNFEKKPITGDPCHTIWYGSEPSRVNEVRCQEVMGAAVPECLDGKGDVVAGKGYELPGHSIPILLVKTNGQCVYPTGLVWK